MPTIVVLGNLKIQIYAEDHSPPHFHVRTKGGKAIVKLSDLTVLKSNIDPRDMKIALNWAHGNKEILEDAWSRYNSGNR